MKLFTLRHGKGGALVKNSQGEVITFASKPEAKQSRDELNVNGDNIVVSYGPDHDLFKGAK